MSDEAFDFFHDPSKETNVPCQREKETRGGSAHHRPPPWKEGDQLNDFVLERLLGTGSSGFVYRVLDVRTNRRCAMKLLVHGSPDDLLRNKLGFRRMMSIEHPNLARVDRIYQLGNHIALAMEEIEGITLREAIRGFRSMEPEAAYRRLLELLRDYASGLAVMHANGYIHRDIKPENLMVDCQGRGRVIDYGLVDSFDLDQETYGARGFLLGTPHYFSPEVIWSQRYLPAGDIFSLGIVTLDALCEIHCSSGRRQRELERSNNNQHDDAERIDQAISGLSASVPDTILEACREMLERSPSERPTAIGLARLGIPRSLISVWPHEEPIVGRDAERREIVAWVEDIFCGNVGRLHLSGPSGIGKTRLMEQVVDHIESKHWGQVFRARCRLREDQPLQAFDQICDAIAHRYMKGDRERLELDPASVALLQEIFPVLQSVFTSSMHVASTGTGADVEPLDALEAAARMSDQLRLVGPLFLIIDDAQWADRDSLNVLDRLQVAVGREGLGIITVSRESEDRQRLSANKYVELKPLALEDSVTILARAAQRWDVDISAATLRALAESTDGRPFRLRELADEFRPGGFLCDNPRNSDDAAPVVFSDLVDQLWKRRAKRLSQEATEVLTYVVASGGRVSTEQLGELTGLGTDVDVAVSELARQRLITDEATGGECIAIFHDHVADELVKTLSDQALTKAHHAWARLLSRCASPDLLAARIAGHFFAAGEPGRAVAHAILAAEDAERRAAITEAGRWYAKVIDHVEGAEKINALRNAARLYFKADYPLDAAEYYRQLADLVGEEERIECRLLGITLLIRSGRYAWARDQLQQFAASLGLPRPKPAWQTKVALITKQLLANLRGSNALTRSVIEASSQDAETDPLANSATPLEAQPKPSSELQKKLRAVRFCDSLIRPLSVFDNLYAAELSLAASQLSLKYGSLAQRIHFAIGESVFHCYDKGQRRIQGETNLLALKPHVDDLQCEFTAGEFWAGMAYSHALACRWGQVSQPVQTSLQHYRNAGQSHGFELAHTQWLDHWANWNLGRWRMMRSTVNRELDDAQRRNDLLQQILTCSGLGAAAFLTSDQPHRLQSLQASNLEFDRDPDSTQLLHVFDWIAAMQLLLYQGRFDEAWSRIESMEPSLQRLPFSGIQMFRVTREMLGAITALHHLSQDFRDIWRLRAQLRIDQLRHEHLAYSTMLANFYEGLLQLCVARHEKSDAAEQEAKRRLVDARAQSLASRLRPYQLAAEDKLAAIQTGRSPGRLEERMIQQQIANPAFFSRLYTIAVD